MNSWSKNDRILKLLPLFLLAFVIKSVGLQDVSPPSADQSQFSMETDAVPIQHPKDVPESALQLLRNDRLVLNCSRAAKMSPDQVPALWFVASETHLDGHNEKDLVVQRRDLHLGPAPNACLMGVNVKPFWIFRETGMGYSLVLFVAAHDLKILETRSKGLRDVRASAMTAVTGYSATYKYDGEKYQVSQRDPKPLE
jgi:hypothetical protein